MDGEGVWPLLAAVRCRQEAMARLLVDQGARSQRDTTRLCNELHVLADIQKGGPFPTPPVKGVHWVTRFNAWSLVWRTPPPAIRWWQLLLAAGADPNQGDADGVTPFQLACGYGNWAAVVFMLQGGHVNDISRTDHQGRTAMDHAAQSPLIRTILVAYAKQYSLTAHSGDFPEGYELMRALPLELLANIFSRLEPYDLCTAASIFDGFCSHNILWQQFCDKRWRLALDGGETWKGRYMTWLHPRLKQHAISLRSALSAPTYKVILVSEPGTAVLHQCLVREGYPKRLIDGVEVRLEIVHHSMSTQRDDICKPPAQAAAVIAMAYDIANREDRSR